MPTTKTRTPKAKVAPKPPTKSVSKVFTQTSKIHEVKMRKKNAGAAEPPANPEREAALLVAVGKEPC